jgi:hypothetical protein
MPAGGAEMHRRRPKSRPKFAIYEYRIFSERSRVRAAFRSLRQVPRTARANRIP